MARNGFFRFSISSILWLTLMVAVFFGGRISMLPELERTAAQSEHQRALAELQMMRAIQQARIAQKLTPQLVGSSKAASASSRRFVQANGNSLENSWIVTFVADGDTVKVLQNRQEHWIRLAGIDCPEKDQPFGTSARSFVNEFCFGRQVEVVKQGADRYERVLADILVDGRSLSQALLKAGLAWHLPQFNSDPVWAQLHAEAKRQGIGLWAQANPVSPVDWKKRQRRRQ